MAIRSGAGTGVIVSLVVFVLATVFLLVLSIVFYASSREQAEKVKDAEVLLSEYATGKERSSDSIQTIVAEAKKTNQSVTSYLNSDIEKLNTILNGNPSASIDEITTEFSENIEKGVSLAIVVRNLKRSVDSRQQEVNANLAALMNARNQINDLEAQLAEQITNSDIAIQTVKREWQGVQDESDDLKSNAHAFFTSRKDRDDRLKGNYIGRIQQSDDDIETLRIDNDRLKSIIDDLRSKSDANKMGVVNPATLVDGTVLDVSTGNEVFIDRGSNDRIVLGMTFELYDSASQLRLDENGNFPRGKASVEVVKVGLTTSTAIITRSTTSQPIVGGNIIVNAVYDPNYEYSFLVHGAFDADGDGVPETNNSFIRDQIERWGGKVIADQGQLPGDLDFLVLGSAPIEPAGRPQRNATPAMLDDYARRKKAYVDYQFLLDQARDAQVPVLTANRLHVLTGQRDR